MWQLTYKKVVTRYLCVVAFLSVVTLIRIPSEAWLIFVIAVVSLKYLIYDGIVTGVIAKIPSFNQKEFFVVGYVLAVLADAFFLWSAGSHETDADFAILGTFLATPWILGITLLVIVLGVFLKRRG